ncbi:hypothetical protein PG984_009812 [Apiospora sp. TS-2023a]
MGCGMFSPQRTGPCPTSSTSAPASPLETALTDWSRDHFASMTANLAKYVLRRLPGIITFGLSYLTINVTFVSLHQPHPKLLHWE